MANIAAAKNYVARIRNAAKARYAQAYLQWLLAGRRGQKPERGGLGYMGAQAVSMELENLLGEPLTEERATLWQMAWHRFCAEHRQGGGTEAEIDAMNNDTVADYMQGMLDKREIDAVYPKDATMADLIRDSLAFIEKERA